MLDYICNSSQVAVVFGYENLSGFLHDTVDVFVSLLVANGSENAYKCIQFIAQKFKKVILYSYGEVFVVISKSTLNAFHSIDFLLLV